MGGGGGVFGGGFGLQAAEIPDMMFFRLHL